MKSIPLAFFLSCIGLLSAAPMTVIDLRTEQQTSPAGVGTTPRFSWKLASNERGKRQTAYQILAATSPEKLTEKNADLWDSKTQATGLKNLVPWKGKDLKETSKVHWKVRVWDERKEAGPWSKPASFKVDGKSDLNKPRRISTFESSSPELNQLYADSIALLEKRLATFAEGDPAALGKGDQVHRSARSMLYHFDSTPHLTHWLRLMDANLTKDKTFTLHPSTQKVGSVSSDAAIITHHPVWWMGGDASYPKDRWKLYEDHMIARENNDRAFKGTKWGEITGSEGMTAEYLDLVYLGFATRLVRELATPAQQPLNVIRFQDYAARIRKSFEAQYLTKEGSLKVPSQSAHVIALRSAVLKPEQQQQIIADLITSLSKNGPQVGPIGAHFLPGVLTLTGHQNEAVKMLTSLDEKQKEAFTGNGVSAWLMSYLAGIDTSFPGFQQIMITPQIPSDNSVTSVKASYESPGGTVSVHWQKLKDGGLKVDLTIPAGNIARINLPGSKEAKITEGGKSIADSPAVEIMGRSGEMINLISQSGTYSYLIK